MLSITNLSILKHEESRVNYLLNESNFVSYEQQLDGISEWMNDYELGVFDSLKIELHDIHFDNKLTELYNRLNQQLEVISDILFTDWIKKYNRLHC